MKLADTGLYVATGGAIKQISWGPDTYATYENGHLVDENDTIVDITFDMAVLDTDWEYVMPSEVARIQLMVASTKQYALNQFTGAPRTVAGPKGVVSGACDCGKEKHGFSHHISGCPAKKD